MKSIERNIGHFIVLASPQELIEITGLLEQAGFQMRDDVIEANAGIRSRLFPIGGGGFIEVASEVSPGSFAHVKGPNNPFNKTPRLVSVSYTTDDAAADLARWRELGEERPHVQCGSWKRQDGTLGYFVAASPTPPAGDVFFVLRETRLFPLPYLDSADTAPPVRRITVTGSGGDLWRKRHGELFALPEKGGVLRAGPTELIFQQTDAATTQITVTFAVPNPNVRIPLVAGRFEFVPAGAGRGAYM